jgi:hypothetical protein
VASAVAQLIWGVALIAGLPVILAAGFGWPLPAQVPSWSQISSTPLRFVDPTVIVNAFVCVAWVTWIILTAYTVLGLIDTIRGIPRRHHRISPLAAVAGKIVASVLLLAALTRPVTVAALPTPPAGASLTLDDQPPPKTIPADTPIGEAITPTAIPRSEDTAVGDPVYVVQRGDTLWDIAERHLGDPFRWHEIRDLNPQLIVNPSLICTGWQLTLPHDANLPTPEEQAPVAPLEPPAPGDAPSAPPASVGPAPTTSSSSPAAAPVTDPAPLSDPTGESSSATSLAFNIAGLAGATVLATGLLAALRRQRRQRRPGPLPFSDATDLERELVAASDLPLVRWVGQELAALGELLAGHGPCGVPVAVEFSESTGIELLWDQPAEDPPPPWTGEPGGWSWQLPYHPGAPVPVAEYPSVLPGLVTIGRREGRQLMVNLEALGAVALVGDPEATRDLHRAMLLELATSHEIAQARVIPVDPSSDLRLDDDLGIAALPIDEALDHLAAAVTEADRLLDRVGCSTTFGYRTFASPVLPLEVTVIAGRSDVADLVDCALTLPAHRAAAMVLLGRANSIENRIVLVQDGTARLEPLGIAFTPTGLSADTGAALTALLTPSTHETKEGRPSNDGHGGALHPWWLDTDAAASAVGPHDVTNLHDSPMGALNRIDSGSGLMGEVAELPLPEIPAFRMMVKVLGHPRLVGGPAVGRRELAVIALVACSARPVTHEQVQDAIWGSSPVTQKTVFNLIGSSRSALGSWDGEPVLSSATRPDNSIALHRDVGTDLRLLRALVHRAELSASTEAMRLLVDALELVEGPPFDAAGYDWAITDQIVSEAEHLIEHAAVMAAELAVDGGDLNRARWAIVQGLRAIPGDESLYRLRMKVEDAAGNPAGVRRAFDELDAHLEAFGLGPSPATLELLAELTAGPNSRAPRDSAPSMAFIDAAQ